MGSGGLDAAELASYSRAYFLAVPGRVQGLVVGDPAQALTLNEELLQELNGSRPGAPDARALLMDQAEALKWVVATNGDAPQALRDRAGELEQESTLHRLAAQRDAIALVAQRAAVDLEAHPALRLGFGLDGGFAGLAAYAHHQASVWESGVATLLEEAHPYSTFFQHPSWHPASIQEVENLLAGKRVQVGTEQAAAAVPWTLGESNVTGSDAAAAWLAGAWSLGATELRLHVFWANTTEGPVFQYCAEANFETGLRAYCPPGTGARVIDVGAVEVVGLGVLRDMEPLQRANTGATHLTVRNGEDHAYLGIEASLRLLDGNATATAHAPRLEAQGVTDLDFGVLPRAGPAVLEVRSLGRLVLRCHLFVAPGAGALS